ncbi:MAG: TRAP transporter substrate-binding protein DctP [Alphaproteobacteria bacterium]|nr:TRAP transporter substrate-binding protein DctP [Alphaproteobacteria bacterium]
MSYRSTVMAGALAAATAFGAANAQAQNLVYANSLARTHVQFGVVADEWINEIQRATNNRVRIRHVPGGALLKLENMIEGLRNGVADAGVTNVSSFPGQLPITATMAGTADITLGNRLDTLGLGLVVTRLLQEFPQITQEFTDVGLKPLVWIPTFTFAVIARDPIATLADFQGKKIRAFGPNLPRVLSAAGATPLAVAVNEVYTSLQTGVIDAAMTDPPNMITGRWYEQARNVIHTGPGVGAQTLGIGVSYIFNLNSWNRISQADREAIERISAQVTLAAGRRMQETGEAALRELREKGVTVRSLSAADTAELARRTGDFAAIAEARMNELGRPGTAIMARYRQLVDDYAAGRLRP